jgi:hypothetical protein
LFADTSLLEQLPMNQRTCLIAAALLAVTSVSALPSFLYAQAPGPVQPRQGPVDMAGTYMPVPLGTVANAPGNPVLLEQIKIQTIPFDLSKADKGALSLKPIGWKAWNNEAAEYPGYIAKYDMGVGGYERAKDGTIIPDPTRAIVQVPVDDYSAIWLLAATDDDKALSDQVSFRLGIIDGQARTTYHDFSAVVPRESEKAARGNATLMIPNADKSLFLVRVPIQKAIAQDFNDRRALDLDITKSLRVVINQPDPNRYQLRPLGPDSGVKIYAMTMERAPVRLQVEGLEPGNVFNQPQKPTFDVTLFNTSGDRPIVYSLACDITRDDGQKQTIELKKYDNPYGRVYANNSDISRVELPITEPGQYRVNFRLMQGTALVLSRTTTCAVLLPDTRKYRAENQFGTWDFGGPHYSPNNKDIRGSLAKKLGLRYMMFSPKWGLEQFNDPRITSEKSLLDHLEYAKKEGIKTPRVLIFHEGGISGPQLTRTPEAITGKPYKLDAAEQKQFDVMWKEANEVYAAVQKHIPGTEIYFGNGVPHTIEEFLKNKVDPKMMAIAGNESGSFMRPPETQPPDYVANNSGIWIFRRVLDYYGYKDSKIYQCYEIGYPNTNPGNLTEQTQADYVTRNLLHSLAWGVPKLGPLCIADMGNSYYHSNWGASGMMYAWPALSPKPSFVAYAVLTQMLDGAKFTRIVPTGSLAVYAIEFSRKDGGYVTALWTPRGQREVTIGMNSVDPAKGDGFKAVNIMGRTVAPGSAGGGSGGGASGTAGATFTLSPSLTWLTTAASLTSITPGLPINGGHVASDKPLVLDPMSDPAAWTVVSEPSSELEVYNFMCPREQGGLTVEKAAEIDGKKDALKVTPIFKETKTPDLAVYAQTKPKAPIKITGEPTEIGLWVQGNAGWGRVIFELQDAAGQRWVSLGAEQDGEPNTWMADWLTKEEFEKLKTGRGMGVNDWNSNDAWGRSNINHEGWRYVRFPLPGQYPGEGYHWPYNNQWRATNTPKGVPIAQSKIVYPITLTGVTYTFPRKVLYLTEYKPAARPEIYVKDLTVTYRPIEEVTTGE